MQLAARPQPSLSTKSGEEPHHLARCKALPQLQVEQPAAQSPVPVHGHSTPADRRKVQWPAQSKAPHAHRRRSSVQVQHLHFPQRVREGPLERMKLHDGRPAAYGSVRFPGRKTGPSKWAAFSSDTSVEWVIDLLIHTWRLPPPDVIISVTGAADFTMQAMSLKEQLIFRRGLLKAAKRTNGWIVTGGTHAGVMKLVGQMLHESDSKGGPSKKDTVVLGVATMGSVYLHEQMLEKSGGRIFNYQSTEVPTEGEHKPAHPSAALDPNHSHFLLVDDGSVGKFGREISLRAELQEAICKRTFVVGGMTPPMVLLVVSGGVGTLDTVKETLENKRPVVVLADSGGAAWDIYSYVTDNVLPRQGEITSTGRVITAEYAAYCERALPEIKHLGKASVGANKTGMITFFRPEYDVEGQRNNLDHMILSAILSDCEKTSDAIMYAVMWGEPSIIVSQLENSHEADPVGLGKALELALIRGTTSNTAAKVVETLIAFDASTKHVAFDKLFELSRDIGVEDKNGLIGMLTANDTSIAEKFVQKIRPQEEEHTPRGKGFRALTQWLDMCGYDINFRTREMLLRSKLKPGLRPLLPNKVNQRMEPSWTELMVWAVVVGEPTLARLMWSRCSEPIRAAVMASRLCQKIYKELPRGSDDLEREQKEYEKWAVSILDVIDEPWKAVHLLTQVPQKSAYNQLHALWPDSVMDQASQEPYPCRQLVAHRHAQYLLTHYMCGDYDGSPARIEDNSRISFVLVQVCLQLLHIFTFGLLQPNKLCLLKAWKPASGAKLSWMQLVDNTRQGSPLPDSRASFTMGDDDDDEFDATYFDHPDVTTRRDQFEEPESATSFKNYLEISLGFFCIPQVKIVTHGVFYIGYILLYWLLLTGSHFGVLDQSAWPWMYRLGTLKPDWPHGNSSSTTAPLIIELLLWSFYFGRVFEEGIQMQLQTIRGYFASYWNQLDFATLSMMTVCLVMRTLVWIDGAGALYGGEGQLGLSYNALQHMQQMIQCLFATSSVLVVLRFLETLSYSNRMGELIKMFRAMVAESATVVVLLFTFILAFGIAFSALAPSLSFDKEYWRRPIFFGMWALYGEFPIDAIYDALGADNWLNFTAVGLLWIYTLFTTVFLVNLMIAQMTNSYEKIKKESYLYRCFERVGVVVEYKDYRNAVPPPLNVVWVVASVVYWIMCCCCKRKPTTGKASGFSVFKDEETSANIRYTERELVKRVLKQDSARHRNTNDFKVDALHIDSEKIQDTSRLYFEATVGRFDHLQHQLNDLAAQVKWLVSHGLSMPDGSGLRGSHISDEQVDVTGGGVPPWSEYQPKQFPPLVHASKSNRQLSPINNDLSSSHGVAAYLASRQQAAAVALPRHRQAPALTAEQLPVPRTLSSDDASSSRPAHGGRVAHVFAETASPGSSSLKGPQLDAALRALGVAVDDKQAYLHDFGLNANSVLSLDEFAQLTHHLTLRRAKPEETVIQQPRQLPAMPNQASFGASSSTQHAAEFSGRRQQVMSADVSRSAEASLKHLAHGEPLVARLSGSRAKMPSIR
ncbi:hypothetical protein AB1Y20_003361 [Prymnesium parvum]|uniref:Transient receptor potential cation channel subfamily M member 2 n=1 Tax=Prymnesium parvum TaxID=97485 RepID=A0AB34JBM7_PRYPA